MRVPAHRRSGRPPRWPFATVEGATSMTQPNGAFPSLGAIDAEAGLYNPANERDSCGVGFIVNLNNKKSHQIVEDGLTLVRNLTHRGAVGADPLVGDGAGILVQIPHGFFAGEAERLGFRLPAPGEYAAAHVFTPQDAALREAMERIVE